jgi:DNA polymerase-3 subunit gamma/tau
MALFAIARGAEGCMRDAESTLDQLISFCGRRIVEADVLSMFGLTAHRQLHDLARAMLSGESAVVLKTIGELVQNGKDLPRLLTDLLGHFRQLLVLKIIPGNDSLVEIAEADATALQEQAAQATTEGLTRMLETLVEIEGRLRDSTAKRIALEIGLLKTMEARQAVSIDTVLQTLHQLRATGGIPSVPSVSGASPVVASLPAEARPVSIPAAPSAPVATSEAPSPRPLAAGGETAGLAALWSDWLDRVGQASPFVRSYLLALQPVSWENQVLTIGIHPEAVDQSELLDNAKNRNLMVAKLKEMGFDAGAVRFVRVDRPVSVAATSEPTPSDQGNRRAKAGTTTPPVATTPKRTEKAAAAPARLDPQEFKNDPLIQKALEVFKGQIAGVQSPN